MKFENLNQELPGSEQESSLNPEPKQKLKEEDKTEMRPWRRSVLQLLTAGSVLATGAFETPAEKERVKKDLKMDRDFDPTKTIISRSEREGKIGKERRDVLKEIETKHGVTVTLGDPVKESDTLSKVCIGVYYNEVHIGDLEEGRALHDCLTPGEFQDRIEEMLEQKGVEVERSRPTLRKRVNGYLALITNRTDLDLLPKGEQEGEFRLVKVAPGGEELDLGEVSFSSSRAGFDEIEAEVKKVLRSTEERYLNEPNYSDDLPFAQVVEREALGRILHYGGAIRGRELIVDVSKNLPEQGVGGLLTSKEVTKILAGEYSGKRTFQRITIDKETTDKFVLRVNPEKTSQVLMIAQNTDDSFTMSIYPGSSEEGIDRWHWRK